ncbi:hypothetical protein GCM10027592_25810 [Spirosoma flavus]
MQSYFWFYPSVGSVLHNDTIEKKKLQNQDFIGGGEVKYIQEVSPIIGLLCLNLAVLEENRQRTNKPLIQLVG